MRILSHENPHEFIEEPLQPQKFGVWAAKTNHWTNHNTFQGKLQQNIYHGFNSRCLLGRYTKCC